MSEEVVVESEQSGPLDSLHCAYVGGPVREVRRNCRKVCRHRHRRSSCNIYTFSAFSEGKSDLCALVFVQNQRCDMQCVCLAVRTRQNSCTYALNMRSTSSPRTKTWGPSSQALSSINTLPSRSDPRKLMRTVTWESVV